MSKKTRFFMFFLGIVFILFLLIAAYLINVKDTVTSTDDHIATMVAVEVAREDTEQLLLSGVGELEATQQVMLTSEANGLVKDILFQPGESVEAGQVLVKLNDAPEQARLSKLYAESVNAKAQLARTRLLIRQDAATQEQLDQAQAQWKQLQGEIAHIKALIDQKNIKAPFNGVLGFRNINKGQFIHAGDAMVSLTDTHQLYANITLPERSLPMIKKGQEMILTVDSYPNQTFKGLVTTIEPLIDKSTRTVFVQATISNPNNMLFSGMFVKGVIKLTTEQKTISISETAIGYNAYGDYVYLVEKNPKDELVARQVRVKVGKRDGDRVDIIKGIVAGDRVVTSGQLRLTNGSIVQVLSGNSLSKKKQKEHNFPQQQSQGGK